MENDLQQPPMDDIEQGPPGHLHSSKFAKPRARRGKKWLLIGLAALMLTIVGVALLWWFGLRTPSVRPAANDSAQQQMQPESENSSQTPQTDTSPVTFKSSVLNIEIAHRKDWKLKESTDKTQLTLTSPTISYVKKDGTAAQGVFTLKLRKGATTAMKANVEKAVAVRDSEVIGYAAPTENQRHYTNISFGGTTDAFNFFIVTGSTTFKAGQPFAYALMLGGDTYLIAGGYGADTADTLAFDPVPKTAIESEAYKQAVDIVESLKIY
ncbi:MAG TPA: hypothetical protein VJ836_03885 [Candidatus Saccharimonadales bacterium]|nr:hypothetical protein [Candidatus Saccharimonadales bacterium]